MKTSDANHCKTDFLSPKSKESYKVGKKDLIYFSRINGLLNDLDEKLEKLEESRIDFDWEIPASFFYELSEIHYKLVVLNDRMSRILSFKKSKGEAIKK